MGRTPAGAAKLSTIRLRSSDRSWGHFIAADGQDGNLRRQGSRVEDAEDFAGVLLRLFFGAKPLWMLRLGRPGWKFNSIISHTLIISLNEGQCR